MAKRTAKSAPIAQADSAAAPSEVGPEEFTLPRITLLDQIIGHEAPKRNLASAMRSGRLHHAWLFHGPEGVGKFSTAYAFGAAILDPTLGPDLSGNLAPDPESSTQRLAKAGTHPDLHVVNKELAKVSRDAKIRAQKQTVIAKDVLEEFLLEPASRTRVIHADSIASKVFIVDEAELMNPLQQNSLLKLLEEPPAGCVIILVSAYADRLLPTIRSRSQVVGFGPLDEREMKEWWKQLPTKPQAEEAAWVLKNAAGAPGAALAAIRNGLFEWHRKLAPMLEALAKGVYPAELGPTLTSLVNERSEAVVKANPEASKEAANRLWARRALTFAAEQFRSTLRSRVSSDAAAAESDAVLQRALAAIDAVSSAERYVGTSVQPPFVMENLVAMAMGDSTSSDQID